MQNASSSFSPQASEPAPQTLSPASYPRKKSNLPMVLGLLILLLVVIGGGVAYYLSQTSQEIRQQASGGDIVYTAPLAGGGCPSGYVGGYVDGTFRCWTTVTSGGATPSQCQASGLTYCAATATTAATCVRAGFGCPTECNTGYTWCSILSSCVANASMSSVCITGLGADCSQNPAICASGLTCISGKCAHIPVGGVTGCDANPGLCSSSQTCVNDTCQTSSVNPFRPSPSPLVQCSLLNPCQSGSTCNTSTGFCVPNGGVGGVGGQCIQAGQSCETGGTCCSGSYCQGVVGSRKCQTPTPNFCGTGATCGGSGGVIAFHCTQLTSGKCQENPKTFDESQISLATAYAGTCGQVDTVCVGGAQNRNLCGGFSIFSSGCTGGQSTPTPTPSSTPTPTPTHYPSPSPVPSPTPAPVCLNITSSGAYTLNNTISFTCGTVQGAKSYEFRVKLPDGTIKDLTNTARQNTSASLTINQAGSYQAQCRICTSADASTCQAYEALK